MSNTSPGLPPAAAEAGTTEQSAPGAGPGTAGETAADRVRARWSEPPAPVPPRWRRVRRATWIRAGAAVGAVLVVAALAVPGHDEPKSFRLDPPESIGELARAADDTGRYAELDREVFPDVPGTIRYHRHFVTGYRLPGSDRADFTVAGATGSFGSPVDELERLLGGMDPAYGPNPGHDPSAAARYTVLPPGPLGGYLKCADGGAGLVAACAWADQSGTTVGAVADRRGGSGPADLAELADRARTIRAAMTHRER
ncbi:hypothetical protein ACFYUY_26425 [Kitasatospora sp. NPDC004745]|uniref:hypothetical protein n=1 Tax=unclassified Kitasatospora TaxID=2633591 RepID=UPI0033DE6F8E